VLADVDRSNYGKLERGERLPSLGTAFRIATALKIAPSVLIARVEDDLGKSTK
jgi:transcriptional regulator with XRE-family HTH domain